MVDVGSRDKAFSRYPAHCIYHPASSTNNSSSRLRGPKTSSEFFSVPSVSLWLNNSPWPQIPT